MKKPLLIGVVLSLALVAALFVVFVNEEGDADSTPASEVRRETSASPPQRIAPRAAVPQRRATLAGRVLHGGKPVEGAAVLARSESEVLEVVTDEGGEFVLRLAAGSWLLSAVSGDAASEVLGPIAIQEDQALDGLVLELLASARVSGRVVDAISGEAIAGAQVRSSSGSVVCDHAGRFTLGPLPPAETWIEASSPSHLARLEWLTLDGARDRGGLELFLRPAARISGQVTREGTGVSGAVIGAEIIRAAGADAARTVAPTRADAQGRFSLVLPGGVVQLWAAPGGGARVDGSQLRLAEGEQRENVDIELGVGATARGTVFLQSQPLPYAQLVLLAASAGDPVALARTDAAGTFTVEGLAPGSYLVQVTAGTLTAQRGPFTLTGDADAPWELVVDAERTIGGNVVPPSAGVRVRWRAPDWAGPYPAETATAADGTFLFVGVPEGLLTVEAEGEAGAASARTRAGESVTLALTQSVLRGSVEDGRGRSVTDYTVRLEPQTGGAVRTLSALSPTGAFVVTVPPGRYRVLVRAPGFGGAEETPTVEVPAGGEASVVIKLRPGRRLRGVVRDHASKKPISGVEVGFYVRSQEGLGTPVAVVRTGADGRFELASVPANVWTRLKVAGYRQEWVAPKRLPSDEHEEVEWLLGPGSDRHGENEPYEGIGAVLAAKEGTVIIGSVFDGGPAQVAGLARGDVILAIDGLTVTTADQLQPVVQRIMGPAGSVVRLTIRKGEETLVIPVRRRKIAPP